MFVRLLEMKIRLMSRVSLWEPREWSKYYLTSFTLLKALKQSNLIESKRKMRYTMNNTLSGLMLYKQRSYSSIVYNLNASIH